MITILITGINGFLGSYLAKFLNDKKFRVLGLEYSIENLYRLESLNIEVFSFKENRLQEIFKKYKIDIIIHTATVYSTTNSSNINVIETNILLPTKLLEIGQENGTNYFINTDTFFNNTEYSYSYLSSYTQSKMHCLEWLKKSQKNMRIINMKIFHMYLPFDSDKKFVTKIVNDLRSNIPKINLTPGEQMRDFVYIKDVVLAFYIIIINLKDINENYLEFEVGTGNAISIKEFVQEASKVLNSKSELIFGALDYRDGEIMKSEADISRLSRFGWKPIYSLEQALKEL